MTNVRPPIGDAKAPSDAAVGWVFFASMMMILIGSFQAIVGLVGIIDDEFYVKTTRVPPPVRHDDMGLDSPHPRHRHRGLGRVPAHRFGVGPDDRGVDGPCERDRGLRMVAGGSGVGSHDHRGCGEHHLGADGARTRCRRLLTTTEEPQLDRRSDRHADVEDRLPVEWDCSRRGLGPAPTAHPELFDAAGLPAPRNSCRNGQASRTGVAEALPGVWIPSTLLGRPVAFDADHELIGGRYWMYRIEGERYQLIP